MQMLVLKGTEFTSPETKVKIPILQTALEIDNFLAEAKVKNKGQEIFIDAHGYNTSQNNIGFGKTLLSLPTLNKNLDYEAISIIDKIINNTESDEINIIHVAACHSGDLDRDLDNLKGDIILITYSNENRKLYNSVANKLYINRVNNHYESLFEYLTNNFGMLATQDAKISIKINNDEDDEIYQFGFNNTCEVSTFSKNLEVLFERFQKFCLFIHEKFYTKYPEIFPYYDMPISLNYDEVTLHEINVQILLDLILEEYNKFAVANLFSILENKLTDKEILALLEESAVNNIGKNILNILFASSKVQEVNTKIVKELIGEKDLKDKEIKFIELGLKYFTNVDKTALKTILNNLKLTDIVKYNVAELVNLALEDFSSENRVKMLDKAIKYFIQDGKNIKALQTLLAHSDSKVNSENLYEGIIKGDKSVIEVILNHDKTIIDVWSFNEVMLRTKDEEIKELIITHASSQKFVNEYFIKNIKNINNLVKILPYMQINEEHIEKAYATNDSNIIYMVNNYLILEEQQNEINVLGNHYN